jgi:hypothetical protein
MPVRSWASTLTSFHDNRSYSCRVCFPGSAASIRFTWHRFRISTMYRASRNRLLDQKSRFDCVYCKTKRVNVQIDVRSTLSPRVDSTGIICEAAALFLVRRCLVTLMLFELWLLRNEAATSEIIPALCMRRTKLISNQLGLHVVNIASCIPSRRRIKLPLHYNNLHKVLM